MEGETQYAAVTGDLVASRRWNELRDKVQRHTLEAVEELNAELGDALARPLVLTAGDEVQGLLRRPSGAVRIVQALRDRLFGATTPGQEIAFGIGWGPLSTGLPPDVRTVEHLDGACFHHAREVLEEARKDRAWVRVRGFGALTDGTLDALFELMGAIRSGWTPTQSAYTVLAREHAKRVDVAKAMGVRPSVVTESLQASRFDAIVRGEEAARALLERFDPAAGEAGP